MMLLRSHTCEFRVLKMKVKQCIRGIQNFLCNTIEGKVLLLQALPLLYVLSLFHFESNEVFPGEWNAVYKQPSYPKIPKVIPSYNLSHQNFPRELTIVSAYFNLGTFDKGETQVFTLDTYKNWMKSYGKLNNSIVVFTDIVEIKSLLLEARQGLPPHMTKIILINRDDLWSFKLKGEIKSIFSQKGYPKHKPNTVNELYPCAMHAKYDVMEYVIQNRLYSTQFLAWIDIGYFRNNESKFFKLLPPDDLPKGHIAFTQINSFYSWLTPRDVVYENYVWIAGGFFIGEAQYLLPFIEDYRRAVKIMMSQRLMSTDQQVLYLMYLYAGEYLPRLPLKLYYHKCRCYWFQLGEVCRETYDKRMRITNRLIYYMLSIM